MKNDDTCEQKTTIPKGIEQSIDELSSSSEKKGELPQSLPLSFESSAEKEKVDTKRIDRNKFSQSSPKQSKTKPSENRMGNIYDSNPAASPGIFPDVHKTDFQCITLPRNLFLNDYRMTESPCKQLPNDFNVQFSSPLTLKVTQSVINKQFSEIDKDNSQTGKIKLSDERDNSMDRPNIPAIYAKTQQTSEQINILDGLAKDVTKTMRSVTLSLKDDHFFCIFKRKESIPGPCDSRMSIPNNQSNILNSMTGRALINQYNNEYSHSQNDFNSSTNEGGVFQTIKNANDINIVFDQSNENSLGFKTAFGKRQEQTSDKADNSAQQKSSPEVDKEKKIDIIKNSISVQCHCTNSKCLKLYCMCFAKDLYCTDCKCQNCENNEEHSQQRDNVKIEIKKKNPAAFPGTKDESKSKRGCNCSKSQCKQKYCECYQNGEKCMDHCRCKECKNTESNQNLSRFSVAYKGSFIIENTLSQIIPHKGHSKLMGSEFGKRKRRRSKSNQTKKKSRRKAKSIPVKGSQSIESAFRNANKMYPTLEKEGEQGKKEMTGNLHNMNHCHEHTPYKHNHLYLNQCNIIRTANTRKYKDTTLMSTERTQTNTTKKTLVDQRYDMNVRKKLDMNIQKTDSLFKDCSSSI